MSAPNPAPGVASEPSEEDCLAPLVQPIATGALGVVVVGTGFDASHRALRGLAEGVRIVGYCRTVADLGADVLQSAQVIYNCSGNAAVLRDLYKTMPSLKWIHSRSTGVTHLLFNELVDSDRVMLTNCKGIYEQSLAEFALSAMLHFVKSIPRRMRQKDSCVYDQFVTTMLRNKVMAVIGYGSIGKCCARLAKAVGMKIHVLSRHPKSDTTPSVDGVADAVYGADEVKELLATADVCLMATPGTPETFKMVGSKQFGWMKKSAIFINVGRGMCVDEAALAACLASETTGPAAAALDVFENEPLQKESPLYRLSHDQVLLSAHCADWVPGWTCEASEQFKHLASEYLRSEGQLPEVHIVNKMRGY